MRTSAAIATAILVLGLGGCRSSWKRDGSWEPRVEAPDVGGPHTSIECGTAPSVSHVMPGDVLIGNLRPGQCQCFSFEGVEYSLLDLALETNCADGNPPTLTVTDPEGRPVDLGCRTGKGGLAADGVILRKSGMYKGMLCREACGAEQVYRFSYDLRLAELDDRRMALTPASNEKVSFVAPRGANCIVQVRPDHACGVEPKVVMVKGPDGMRALALENQIAGACPPRVLLERGATRTLKFIAPQPGRYTVQLAAEEGTSGDATTHVAVIPAASPGRKLFHDGRSCEGGACPPPLAQAPAAPYAPSMPPPPPPPAEDCPDCRPPAAAAAAATASLRR